MGQALISDVQHIYEITDSRLLEIGVEKAVIPSFRKCIPYPDDTWQNAIYSIGKGKHVQSFEENGIEGIADLLQLDLKDVTDILECKPVGAKKFIQKLKELQETHEIETQDQLDEVEETKEERK